MVIHYDCYLWYKVFLEKFYNLVLYSENRKPELKKEDIHYLKSIDDKKKEINDLSRINNTICTIINDLNINKKKKKGVDSMKKDSDYLRKVEQLSSEEIKKYADLMRKRLKGMIPATLIIFMFILGVIAFYTFKSPDNKELIDESLTGVIVIVLFTPFPFITSHYYCKKSDKELACMWIRGVIKNKWENK